MITLYCNFIYIFAESNTNYALHNKRTKTKSN